MPREKKKLQLISFITQQNFRANESAWLCFAFIFLFGINSVDEKKKKRMAFRTVDTVYLNSYTHIV